MSTQTNLENTGIIILEKDSKILKLANFLTTDTTNKKKFKSRELLIELLNLSAKSLEIKDGDDEKTLFFKINNSNDPTTDVTTVINCLEKIAEDATNPENPKRNLIKSICPDTLQKDVLSNKFDKAAKTPAIEFRKPNQKVQFDAIMNNTGTLTLGESGTGKTFIAAHLAVLLLKQKKFKKIVICRPPEGPGKSLGSVPGDIDKKLIEWMIPITEQLTKNIKILDKIDKKEKTYNNAKKKKDKKNKKNKNDKLFTLDGLLKDKRIKLLSLEHLRGINLDDTFIIIDEVQDASKKELKSLLTRLGPTSKIALLGDKDQMDIPESKSGLQYIQNVFENHCSPEEDNIIVTKYEEGDSVRSPFTSSMLKGFKAEDKVIELRKQKQNQPKPKYSTPPQEKIVSQDQLVNAFSAVLSELGINPEEMIQQHKKDTVIKFPSSIK